MAKRVAGATQWDHPEGLGEDLGVQGVVASVMRQVEAHVETLREQWTCFARTQSLTSDAVKSP